MTDQQKVDECVAAFKPMADAAQKVLDQLKADGGGRAFPDELGSGMSLRDYFAAKAMQGWLTNDSAFIPTESSAESHAQQAYLLADAMLNERSK